MLPGTSQPQGEYPVSARAIASELAEQIDDVVHEIVSGLKNHRLYDRNRLIVESAFLSRIAYVAKKGDDSQTFLEEMQRIADECAALEPTLGVEASEDQFWARVRAYLRTAVKRSAWKRFRKLKVKLNREGVAFSQLANDGLSPDILTDGQRFSPGDETDSSKRNIVPIVTPGQVLEAVEDENRTLAELLVEVPPKDLEMFIENVFNDISLEDLGKRYSENPNAISRRLNRMKRRLAERLGSYEANS